MSQNTTIAPSIHTEEPLQAFLGSLTTEPTRIPRNHPWSLLSSHLLRNSLGTSRGTEEDLARRLPIGSAGSMPLGSPDSLSVDLLATWKRDMTSLDEVLEAASTDDPGICAPLP